MTIKDYSHTGALPRGILEIYRASFPTDERRPWAHEDDLRRFMAAHPQMRLRLLTEDDDTLALLIYWHLEDNLLYVEHLATRPDTRGKGLGAQLLRSLLCQPSCSLLLEVEPPTGTMARRRIGFYTRLGLALHADVDYTQPPYSADLNPVPLKIMSTPDIDSATLSARILPTLKATVYHSFEPKEVAVCRDARTVRPPKEL